MCSGSMLTGGQLVLRRWYTVSTVVSTATFLQEDMLMDMAVSVLRHATHWCIVCIAVSCCVPTQCCSQAVSGPCAGPRKGIAPANPHNQTHICVWCTLRAVYSGAPRRYRYALRASTMRAHRAHTHIYDDARSARVMDAQRAAHVVYMYICYCLCPFLVG